MMSEFAISQTRSGVNSRGPELRKASHRTNGSILAGMAMLLLAGCTNTQKSRMDEVGLAYVPRNVTAARTWPQDVRRVAVLPAADATGTLPVSFAASYDAPWMQSLQQSQRAEFVSVSREVYARWTGAPEAPASTGMLPSNWVERIRSVTGADAALLVDITQCSAYPPLSLGLRAKLVRLSDAEVIWAVDEIFDATNPLVSRAAKRFARQGQLNREAEALSILQSPSKFAAYASDALAATLPLR